jgi:hypothetical protein
VVEMNPLNDSDVLTFEEVPIDHHTPYWMGRGFFSDDSHPATISHDRSWEEDMFDALFAVFGRGNIDPNAPHIKPEQRRALRRALVDRGVEPTTVLVPRFVGPRVPAINTFELRDNHTAYDDPDSEVA